MRECKVKKRNAIRCSAPDCKRPIGNSYQETTWVSCDDCQLWFHLICVGLSTILENEDFKCHQCMLENVIKSEIDTSETTEHSKPWVVNEEEANALSLNADIKEELQLEGGVDIKEELLFINVKEEVLHEGCDNIDIKEELSNEGADEIVIKEEVFQYCIVCNTMLDMSVTVDNICQGCKTKTVQSSNYLSKHYFLKNKIYQQHKNSPKIINVKPHLQTSKDKH